jgi:hypothetical protein
MVSVVMGSDTVYSGQTKISQLSEGSLFFKLEDILKTRAAGSAKTSAT